MRVGTFRGPAKGACTTYTRPARAREMSVATSPAPEGLVSPCVACGAPQPITLVPIARPCAFCRAPDPLAPSIRARVAAAARHVAGATDRRVPKELRERAGSLGWMAVVLIGGCFLVSGGIALGWVGSSLPSGSGIVSFLLQGRAPGLNAIDTTAFWWLLFLLTVLLCASFPWVSGGQLAVYMSLRGLRALPPIVPGGPARCHLCGDDLPNAGLVRRCKSCGSDNLVHGARFRRAAVTFDQAILAAQRDAHARIGARIAHIEDGVMWAAGLPFALLILMPISLAFDGPHPELLWVPPALLGLGVVLRVLGALARP